MKPAGYDTALAGAVLVDRVDRGVLRVFGRDPVRMIHGLVTNDVQSLEPGQSTWAAMLTAKGRMIADMRVIRREDDLLLEADRAALPGIRETLARFVPPLFAKFEDLGRPLSIIGVYGPAAARLVGGILTPVVAPAPVLAAAERPSGDAVVAGPSPLDAVPVDSAMFALFGQVIAIVMHTDGAGVDGWDIIVDADAVGGLRSAIREAGAEPASLDAIEVLRIEAGRPRWGAELTEEVIPLEAGLKDRLISTSKGCYTGQEVIIRVLHRGHVNRHLRGIVIADGAPPGPGTELFQPEDAAAMPGRAVGRITSSTSSPRLGRAIALGYVRREVEPGQTVHLGSADGGTAGIVTLPFIDPPLT